MVSRRSLSLMLRGALLSLLALTTVLLGAGLLVRVWIHSDSGRRALVSALDGQELNGLGRISLGSIAGDPLSEVRISSLTFSDDQGPWMVATDLSLDWSLPELLKRTVRINSLTIGEIHVLRPPPARARQRPRSPIGSFGVSLERLAITRLVLDKNAAGVEAELTARLDAEVRRDGSGRAALEVASLGGPGDEADVRLSWERDGRLEGAAQLSGHSNGVMSHLLRAPADQGIELTASLKGHLALLRAEAELTFEGTKTADLDITLAGPVVTANASLQTAAWPALANLNGLLGSEIRLSADVNLVRPEQARTTLRASTGLTRLRASGLLDVRKGRLVGPVETQLSGLPLSSLSAELKGELDVTGEGVFRGLEDWSWRGQGRLSDIGSGSISLRRITAPISLEFSSEALTWAVDGGLIEIGDMRQTIGAFGSRYDLSSRGQILSDGTRVAISMAALRSVDASLNASGDLNTKSQAFSLEGEARLNVTRSSLPISGGVRGAWSAARVSGEAPVSVSVEAQGMAVASRVQLLAELLGPAPRLSLDGTLAGKGLTISSARLEGNAAVTEMSGFLSADGDISGTASLRLLKEVSLSAGRLRSLEARAVLSGSRNLETIELEATDGSGDIGGLAIENLRADINFDRKQRSEGRFTVKARAANQPLKASGRIQIVRDGAGLEAVQASLGDLHLSSSAISFMPSGLEGSFKVHGSLAGLADLDRGTLTAEGEAKLVGGDLSAKLTGRADDIRAGERRVDRAVLDLTIADDHAALAARISGWAGAKADLTLEAEGDVNEERWTGLAFLSGHIADTQVTTLQPTNWSWSRERAEVNGALDLLDGRVEGALTRLPTSTSLSLRVSSIDLGAASALTGLRPISGRLSGSAELALKEGTPAGTFTAIVADAAPLGFESQRARLEASGEIRDGRLLTRLVGSGQGLALEGEGVLPLTPLGGFTLSKTEEISGRLTLKGDSEPVWSLVGPDDQSLRGEILIDARVGGNLLQPEIRGAVELSGGSYEHGDTGFTLRNITAAGQFEGDSFQLRTFEGDDGARGRLKATGDINWKNGLRGDLSFQSDSLQALRRNNLSATVTGKGRIEATPAAVDVSGDLTVTEARLSVETPPTAALPRLPLVRRIRFPEIREDVSRQGPAHLVRLNLKINAPRRIAVFGRGLDTEWSAAMTLKGPAANPEIVGTANLLRGALTLAGQRFAFDTGSVRLSGPARLARVDISAVRSAPSLVARARVSGTIDRLKFQLTSTPALPEDEVLARVLFGRSASELSTIEAAQLAASLAQLAAGEAAFDPTALLRQSVGVDRVSIGARGDQATLSAGKYIAPDVYLEVGSGAEGGLGAEVEWEPREGLSINSSADETGNSRISVRWKKTY